MASKNKPTFGYLIIAFFTVLTGVLIWYDRTPKSTTETSSPVHVDIMNTKEKAKAYPPAVEIVNPSGFINTGKITLQENIGEKVILVDFWTFSCINCQRTLPYLREWDEKYRDKGLQIIGIHTPEFEFEKDTANVQEAVDKWGLSYPVVQDNDYSTWRAYKNNYWPRKYLIDIDGFIVYDHIGEGAYEETEMKIQELLAERADKLGLDIQTQTPIEKPSDVEEIDFKIKRSPETYFGALRNTTLANGRPAATGTQSFAAPTNPAKDKLYLGGSWDIRPEFAKNLTPNATITFRYTAQKVFIVAASETPIRAQVLVDGEPVSEFAGSDIKDGYVTVQNEQLYRLVEDEKSGEHTLQIIVESPGVEFFAFTFG